MKKLIFGCFFFFSSNLFAQKDTLTIPVGKYGFVKIGDKVYKITSSLEEINSIPTLLSPTQIWHGSIIPAFYPAGIIDTTYCCGTKFLNPNSENYKSNYQ